MSKNATNVSRHTMEHLWEQVVQICDENDRLTLLPLREVSLDLMHETDRVMTLNLVLIMSFHYVYSVLEKCGALSLLPTVVDICEVPCPRAEEVFELVRNSKNSECMHWLTKRYQLKDIYHGISEVMKMVEYVSVSNDDISILQWTLVDYWDDHSAYAVVREKLVLGRNLAALKWFRDTYPQHWYVTPIGTSHVVHRNLSRFRSDLNKFFRCGCLDLSILKYLQQTEPDLFKKWQKSEGVPLLDLIYKQSVPILDFLIQQFPVQWRTSLTSYEFVKYTFYNLFGHVENSLEMLQWFLNHTEMVGYLYHVDIMRNLLKDAIYSRYWEFTDSRREMLDYLHQKGLLPRSIFFYAQDGFRLLRRCTLPLLQWIHKTYHISYKEITAADNYMFRRAFKRNNLEWLQWLVETFHISFTQAQKLNFWILRGTVYEEALEFLKDTYQLSDDFIETVCGRPPTPTCTSTSCTGKCYCWHLFKNPKWLLSAD